MTIFHSSTDMLWKMRSRRMPALLTTACSVPKLSVAHWMMRLADAHSATLSVLATALPPAALDLVHHLLRRAGVVAGAAFPKPPGR